jgi:hypothetical protein
MQSSHYQSDNNTCSMDDYQSSSSSLSLSEVLFDCLFPRFFEDLEPPIVGMLPVEMPSVPFAYLGEEQDIDDMMPLLESVSSRDEEEEEEEDADEVETEDDDEQEENEEIVQPLQFCTPLKKSKQQRDTRRPLVRSAKKFFVHGDGVNGNVTTTPVYFHHHKIRLIYVHNHKTKTTTIYVHAADIGSVLVRKSNISRMFGKYSSPDQKRLLNVMINNQRIGNESNILTMNGILRFLVCRDMKKHPSFKTWIIQFLIPNMQQVKYQPPNKHSNILFANKKQRIS